MNKRSSSSNGTNRSRAAREVQATTGVSYARALDAVRTAAEQIPPLPRDQWAQRAIELLTNGTSQSQPTASTAAILVSIEGITVREYVPQFGYVAEPWDSEWDESITDDDEALKCASHYAREFIASAQSLGYTITHETTEASVVHVKNPYSRWGQVDFRARHPQLPHSIRLIIDIRASNGATTVALAEVERDGTDIPERLIIGDEPVPLLHCTDLKGAQAMLLTHHEGIDETLIAVWDALADRETKERQARYQAQPVHEPTADDLVGESEGVIEWFQAHHGLQLKFSRDAYWLETGYMPEVSVHQDYITGEWSREEWKVPSAPSRITPLGTDLTYRALHEALTSPETGS